MEKVASIRMGKMQNEKVSIITVCFNAEKVLEKTIKSVINQTYEIIEYILVDGGSTDGTLEIIDRYDNQIAKVISEPDNGIYDAMNKAIKLATGSWIQFMNAGDFFYSNDTVSNVFSKDYSSDVIYGNVQVVDTFGSYVLKAGEPSDLDKGEICFCHQSTFIKSDTIKSHLFNTDFKICADYDLFYNLWINGFKFTHIDDIVAIYDVSQGSYASSHYKDALLEEYKIVGRHSIRNRMNLYLKVLFFDCKRFFGRFESSSHRINRIRKSLDHNPAITWKSW